MRRTLATTTSRAFGRILLTSASGGAFSKKYFVANCSVLNCASTLLLAIAVINAPRLSSTSHALDRAVDRPCAMHRDGKQIPRTSHHCSQSRATQPALALLGTNQFKAVAIAARFGCGKAILGYRCATPSKHASSDRVKDVSAAGRRQYERRIGAPERRARERTSAIRWCPGAESNHRHCDFQSHALPTELPGRRARPGPPFGARGYRGEAGGCPVCQITRARAPGRAPRPRGRV
jgi:hypothetical protein